MLLFLFIIGYNVYFANLHSHTALSDGEGTPEEAFLYARDSAGIDILAVTDHSHYLTEAACRVLKDVAARFTDEGRFVALFGQEFGSLGQDGFGHVDVFEAESVCIVDRGNLDAFYDWAVRTNRPAQFNHPNLFGKNFNGFSYHACADQVLGLVELLNQDNLAEVDLGLCLAKGWQVGVAANQDNHHRKWGDAPNRFGRIPLCGILAERLSKAEVLEAIAAGRTFAFEAYPSEDRMRLDFTIDGIAMGGRVATPRRTITLRVTASAHTEFDRFYLYRNGFVVDSVMNLSCVTLEYARVDTVGNDYYHVKVVQKDGDRAWSSPIWVLVRSTKGSVEVWPNPVQDRARIIFPSGDDFRLAEVIIGNVVGQRVLYRKFSNPDDAVIETRGLARGVYFVKVVVWNRYGDRQFYQGKMAVIE